MTYDYDCRAAVAGGEAVVSEQPALKPWPEYGCHVDLFDAPDEEPDECVLNNSVPSDCIYGHTSPGRPRKSPHTCKYWKRVA
jgi:hypothetical protein